VLLQQRRDLFKHRLLMPYRHAAVAWLTRRLSGPADEPAELVAGVAMFLDAAQARCHSLREGLGELERLTVSLERTHPRARTGPPPRPPRPTTLEPIPLGLPSPDGRSAAPRVVAPRQPTFSRLPRRA
jgi:hypothetical protein